MLQHSLICCMYFEFGFLSSNGPAQYSASYFFWSEKIFESAVKCRVCFFIMMRSVEEAAPFGSLFQCINFFVTSSRFDSAHFLSLSRYRLVRDAQQVFTQNVLLCKYLSSIL